MPGTTTKIKDLSEKRVKLGHDARAILDEAEKRDDGKGKPTQEEIGRFDEMMDEVDSLQADIDLEQRRERLGDLEGDLNTSRGRRTTPDDPETAARQRGVSSALVPIEYRGRDLCLDDCPRLIQSMSVAYRDSYRHYIKTGEKRDLLVTDNVQGGFLSPAQFATRLIQRLDDALWVREMATVTPVTTGDSLGYPSLDADPDDFDWTPEVKTVTKDQAMKFGKREFRPHLLSKAIVISMKLLRSSAIDVEALVLERLGFKFSVTQEKAFFTGDGNQKPLGIFTVSDFGIDASRDISEDNLATKITADGLINAKYGLKSQYWANAVWGFHRDGVKEIRKLKDDEGQYLWVLGLAGAPDTLLGFRVRMSEFIPNTFTTGQLVGFFGDLSWYWIADSLQFTLQRLEELKAEQNQIEFIGRGETDGAPVLAEAFTRVKLG